MAKKSSFKDIWERIETPAIILIIWTILSQSFSIGEYIGNTLFSILNWGIMIGIFGYLGYSMKKEGEGDSAGKYGAILGVVTGIVGAVLALILFYFVPGSMNEAINQAVQKGGDIEMIKSVIKITLWASLVFGPAISAGIGALISWISSSITKAPMRKRK